MRKNSAARLRAADSTDNWCNSLRLLSRWHQQMPLCLLRLGTSRVLLGHKAADSTEECCNRGIWHFLRMAKAPSSTLLNIISGPVKPSRTVPFLAEAQG